MNLSTSFHIGTLELPLTKKNSWERSQIPSRLALLSRWFSELPMVGFVIVPWLRYPFLCVAHPTAWDPKRARATNAWLLVGCHATAGAAALAPDVSIPWNQRKSEGNSSVGGREAVLQCAESIVNKHLSWRNMSKMDGLKMKTHLHQAKLNQDIDLPSKSWLFPLVFAARFFLF